jgi:alkanesulfonate monooxygenase SsuD/methylene tetrahydromethanopterin reductase-like flavin-dependent oxidoreductase (luciferase family)
VVTVRAGLNLPQYSIDFRDDSPSARSVIEVARAAEDGGFDSVWLSDHPFAIGPDGSVSGALEAATTMGLVASATKRVVVGSLVFASSMRTPEQLAAAARALALVAPARVIVGIGTGWYEPEHRSYGTELQPYPARARRLEDALEAVREVGASTLVGGVSQRVMEVSAKGADWWNCSWDVPVDVFSERSRALDAACERIGRDPAFVGRSVGVTVLPGSRAERLRALEGVRGRATFLSSLELSTLETSIIVGSGSDCAERIAAYGADEVMITPFVRDDLDLIARLAAEVLPLLPGRPDAGGRAAGSGDGIATRSG